MPLNRVTFTGADDHTSPAAMLEISRRFPFVEWGILVSGHAGASSRFPSRVWIDQLHNVTQGEAQLSVHFCGSFLRMLMLGERLPRALPMREFRRAQLNFHGQPWAFNAGGCARALFDLGVGEVIFQIDGHQGQHYLAEIYGNKQAFSCVPLFDESHGAGVGPPKWPVPFDPKTYHGYAGGLGPKNLRTELPLIERASQGCPYWVDMETHVRTNEEFDLEKVVECAIIAREFMNVTGDSSGESTP